jgi:hypothetical protein
MNDSVDETLKKISKDMRRSVFLKELVSLAMRQAVAVDTSSMTPEKKAEEMEVTNRMISTAIMDLFDGSRL